MAKCKKNQRRMGNKCVLKNSKQGKRILRMRWTVAIVIVLAVIAFIFIANTFIEDENEDQTLTASMFNGMNGNQNQEITDGEIIEEVVQLSGGIYG